MQPGDFRRRTINLTALPLLPPAALAFQNSTLFLDLDGTLFELDDCPDAVCADAQTRVLLDALLDRLDGRLAVVSGRSLAQIDDMLGAVSRDIWISGSHGGEHRWGGVTTSPPRPSELDDVAARFWAFAEEHPGVLVEEKSLGVALHYRMMPQAEADAVALATELAEDHGLFLQQGKMMAELRDAGSDKGSAIRAMMAHPDLAGTTPVFAGDDLTDEPGFAAVRDLGGQAILVGEPRPTAARYGLRSPGELRDWLWEALA